MTTLQQTQDEIARCVDQVLRSRRTTRAFLPTAVPKQQVLDILESAATAPSNSNTQPWHVHVLTGAPLQTFAQALVCAYEADAAPPSDHFPSPLPRCFGARQEDFAARYYASLGIDRHDTAARFRQTSRNFSFFGAPVGLIFSIDRRLRPHSWLDLGLFVQNVMIAARARGLATCPQVSFARFHEVIAQQLDLAEEEVTVCGMSLGYADTSAAVNGVAMPRERVEQFARFSGFDAVR